MYDARYVAVDALVKMIENDGYSNIVLDNMLKKNNMPQRDNALATALFYGVLERMITLDHVIKRYSKHKTDIIVQMILRVSLYQILYMDNIPNSAVVNEAVNLAKKFRRIHSGGFINAILRNFLRDGEKIPPIKGSPLSIKYSCPQWIVSLWVKHYGESMTKKMLENSLGRPPLFIKVNTLKTDSESLIKMLTDEGVKAESSDVENCLIIENFSAAKCKAFAQGLFYVQDKASQICVNTLDPKAGERILDVCSAPGGKSFSSALNMQNKGEIIALDLHSSRVNLISEGAKRLGIDIIDTAVNDASVFNENLGLFDKVLCDVPCSGLGIIRRKPEIKYKTWESIEKLPDIQYKILETSAKYLCKGGVMIYSTCTLMPYENEAVVEKFILNYPNFSAQMQTLGASDTDGFFIAKLS